MNIKKFQHTTIVPMSLEKFNPREVRQWLTETIGPEYQNWALLGPAIYGFSTEQDKILFSLKWM